MLPMLTVIVPAIDPWMFRHAEPALLHHSSLQVMPRGPLRTREALSGSRRRQGLFRSCSWLFLNRRSLKHAATVPGCAWLCLTRPEKGSRRSFHTAECYLLSLARPALKLQSLDKTPNKQLSAQDQERWALSSM